MMVSSLYETDFYAWTLAQAELLRQGQFTGLDVVNLIEEVESLGKQQRQELRNRLGVLIGHLLKWEYQPNKRSKSWQFTIREQRRILRYLLQDNPSLKPYLGDAILYGYEAGIDLVLKETTLGKKDLPLECPYTSEQIVDPLFPEGLEEGL